MLGGIVGLLLEGLVWAFVGSWERNIWIASSWSDVGLERSRSIKIH